MTKTEEKEKSRTQIKKKEIISNEESIDLIYRFYMAFKISKIYEPNNTVFIRQLTILLNLIKKAIQIDEETSLTLSQTTLYLNGKKIKFGYSNYYIFKFINKEFRKRKIGILSFNKHLDKEELKNFIFLLSKKDLTTKDAYKNFLKDMKQQGIKHISAEPLLSFQKIEANKKDAKKLFFLGIAHLKEFLKKQKEERTISTHTTRRLIQSIFNHLVDNESFLLGLTTIKNFDGYTLNHSMNVTVLSLALGKRLGLNRNEIADLGVSAFFHDFGKLEIPKKILLKTGKLDKKERIIIEKHPCFGAEKLIQMQEFHYVPFRAINVALEHHIGENQSGYPKYLKKKSINLFSKIVKIADFFDALTTKRPYRKKEFSREEALRFMQKEGRREFDPLILKVFVNMMGIYPIGTLVLLDTGEVGIVFETNPESHYISRPKVKLVTDKNGKKINGKIVDLTEVYSKTKKYKRSIIKSLNPDKYKIKVSDYFIAEADAS